MPTRTYVGVSGGTVRAAGVTLLIPAGALTKPEEIAIRLLDEKATTGFVTASPAYEFRPEGLTFQKQARVTFAVPADAGDVQIFWSRQDGSGFVSLATETAPESASASVSHFSIGFVAQGAPTGSGGTSGNASGSGGQASSGASSTMSGASQGGTGEVEGGAAGTTVDGGGARTAGASAGGAAGAAGAGNAGTTNGGLSGGSGTSATGGAGAHGGGGAGGTLAGSASVGGASAGSAGVGGTSTAGSNSGGMGSGGSCPAGTENCGSGCVDTFFDAARCGSCKNACGAGTCAGGVCTYPETVVATPANYAKRFAVIGDTIFYLTVSYSLMKATIPNGTPTSVRTVTIDTDPGAANYTRFSGDRLYGRSISSPFSSLELNNQHPGDLTYPGAGNALAIDGTEIFFFGAPSAKGGQLGLYSAAAGATVPSLLFAIAEHEPYIPRVVAVDADSIYWIETLTSSPASGRMKKLPRTGGMSPLTLAQGLGRVVHDSFFVAGGYVFFSTSGEVELNYKSVLAKVPINGGALEILASGPITPIFEAPYARSVDGEQLFGSDGRAGLIFSLPVAGGSPHFYASKQNIEQDSSYDPINIVATSTHVYWNTAEGIKRLPR